MMNTVFQRWIKAMAMAAVAGSVALAAAADPLQPGGTARVSAVVDGDTVILEDGKQIRLVGIQAPKLPLGRPKFKTWPLADEAKAALTELALDKTLTVAYGGRRLDRHGRLLAHLHDPSGRWIQGAMLSRGLARTYSFADNRALTAEMLALERQARAARRGIWRHPFYAVRQFDETPRFLNSFQLVEGQILDVARVRSTTYLNFGPDWRTDFTVVVDARARRLFEANGIDLASLEGRRIRVRGWLKPRNGPMIAVSHPEQIERLE